MRLRGGEAAGRRRGESREKTLEEGQRLGLAGPGGRACGASRNCATEQLRHRARRAAAPPSGGEATTSLSGSRGRARSARLRWDSDRARVLASCPPAGAQGFSGSAAPALPPERPHLPPRAPRRSSRRRPPGPDPEDSRPSSAAAPQVPARVTDARRTLPPPGPETTFGLPASAGAARGRCLRAARGRVSLPAWAGAGVADAPRPPWPRPASGTLQSKGLQGPRSI